LCVSHHVNGRTLGAFVFSRELTGLWRAERSFTKRVVDLLLLARGLGLFGKGAFDHIDESLRLLSAPYPKALNREKGHSGNAVHLCFFFVFAHIRGKAIAG